MTQKEEHGAKTLVLPAKGYTAFEIRKGDVLRIVETEGSQVADVNAYNLHDLREKLQSALSAQINGSYEKFEVLYSNSPDINPMFTVTSDPVGVHFLSGSVGCTRRHYEKWGGGLKNHPNCFDNLAMAVKPWGLTHFDVHGPFNAFMRVRYEDNGRMKILPPLAKKGDHVDLRAEMDLLVAISVCPSDINLCNGEDMLPKSLEVNIIKANR